jgi:hypothetical protein
MDDLYQHDDIYRNVQWIYCSDKPNRLPEMEIIFNFSIDMQTYKRNVVALSDEGMSISEVNNSPDSNQVVFAIPPFQVFKYKGESIYEDPRHQKKHD